MNNANQMIGVSPELRAFLGILFTGLPFIRGTWFIVDPYKLTTGIVGIEGAFTNLPDAYDACVSGRGDGIAVVSGGTTAAHTTSDIHSCLGWSKHNITVVGICAPTRMYQRSRINSKQITTGVDIATIAFPTATTITDSASGFLTAGFRVGDILRIAGTGSGTNDGTGHIITAVMAGTITCGASTFSVKTAAETGTCTITTYCSSVIEVSGNNNRFYNLFVNNEDADALALNALKVTGHRNYFENVHVANAIADSAATLARSLWLSACEENTFVNCTFGSDTYDRGNNATYDILLSGTVARNRFYNCETVRSTTVGVACFAVYASATSGGRPTIFEKCRFTCWSSASGNANQSYMFASTGACDFVWFTDCLYPGYAALSNDAVAWISSSYSANVGSGIMYT
jgi:hypothetical protein